MKNNTTITDKKEFWAWVVVSIIIYILFSASIIYADDNRFRGYIEAGACPLNTEHGIYAEATLNIEKPIYSLYGKEIFAFVKPTIEFAHGIKKPDREEKRITTFATGFAYISNFDAGVGIKLGNGWEARFVYRADRTPNGNVGDLNIVFVRKNF